MNTDIADKNLYMLKGSLAKDGYDWWWHSFTARNAKTGEERAFFIEYYVVNPELGGFAPIFGMQGKNRPSYVMIKAGCWGKGAKQLHRFFGIQELNMATDELRMVVGDCFLSEELLRGNVEVSAEDAASHPEYLSDAGSMSWLLHVDKSLPFDVGIGTSKALRDAGAFEMYWHVQGMKTRYDGTVFLDGVEYTVTPETSYGYADKNWGHDFTNPWVWLASSNLTSRTYKRPLLNSAFDIGGGRPKIGPLALENRLLILFTYEGTDFEFNFTKPSLHAKTKFRCYETEDKIVWRIKATSTFGALEADAWCKKEDMLLINYESPKGLRQHNRLWNGGNATAVIRLYKNLNGKKHLIDTIDAKNVGCEYGRY